jgi:hypothetical protein
LYRLQVTARSTLGGLALNCGGLLIDHGWMRMLGAGSDGLPGIATASGLDEPTEASAPPPHLIIAYDVLGGRFAVNGGELPGNPGEVCYWGPNTLEWTPLGEGHTGFFEWTMDGGLEDFHADLRWPGWEAEVELLSPAEGISAFPFPFTEEGRDVGAAARAAVPFDALLDLYDDIAQQMSAAAED